MMTQKSVAEGRNRLELKGVSKDAVMGAVEVNYQEMAKYTFSHIDPMD